MCKDTHSRSLAQYAKRINKQLDTNCQIAKDQLAEYQFLKQKEKHL